MKIHLGFSFGVGLGMILSGYFWRFVVELCKGEYEVVGMTDIAAVCWCARSATLAAVTINGSG